MCEFGPQRIGFANQVALRREDLRLLSHTEVSKQGCPMNSDPEHIELSKLNPGPIRHKSLPPELLEQIHAIYSTIGGYLETTLEQFEIGFMRDLSPEDEVAVWGSITIVWLKYHERFLNDQPLDDEQEKKLLSALIVISTGATELDGLSVLPEVGQRLLECYNSLAEQ